MDALRDAGRPLVYTVHDLVHPQLADQRHHHAQVALLVARADAVITLTAAAADVVERAHGRRPEVIAHPHLHPLDARLPPGRPHGAPLVGLPLRDLRPNVDGERATTAVIAAAARVGAQVRVELRDVTRDPAQAEAVRARCARSPHVELVTGGRPDDAALAAGLADLDVCVLPYRCGTHSGWLELCWDLGVAVAAPRVGALADQHDDVRSFAAWDVDELARALGPAVRPGSLARRRLQASRRAYRRVAARQVAAAHDAVYARVLSGAAAGRR